MKILVLTPGVFDKGGIARYGRFQIRALRDALGETSVRVVSLLGRRADDLEEPFEVDWSGADPPSRVSRVHFAGVAIGASFAWRPDLVLSQHVHFGPLARIAARLAGSRLAQNLYGREIWSGLGRSRRAALRSSEVVIADCHNSAARARELGLVRRDPLVVWDCVDLDRYLPGSVDPGRLAAYAIERTRRFRILFLGRLHRATRYKGTERLLELMTRLDPDGFEAVIAGKGDDVGHLESVARDRGVLDRVSFPGAIHEADLPVVYRSADAFYLVSESGPGKGEGIPLTPLEAMACGVPVIVGNRDGSREIVDSSGGACCDPGDLESQGAYLKRLSGDRAFHDAEKIAARRRAEEAFGFPAFARKTLAALEAAETDGTRRESSRAGA